MAMPLFHAGFILALLRHASSADTAGRTKRGTSLLGESCANDASCDHTQHPEASIECVQYAPRDTRCCGRYFDRDGTEWCRELGEDVGCGYDVQCKSGSCIDYKCHHAEDVCYDAYTPDWSCYGYAGVGYTCNGKWCAAINPGGNPETCANKRPAGWILNRAAGRCEPPATTTKSPNDGGGGARP